MSMLNLAGWQTERAKWWSEDSTTIDHGVNCERRAINQKSGSVAFCDFNYWKTISGMIDLRCAKESPHQNVRKKSWVFRIFIYDTV